MRTTISRAFDRAIRIRDWLLQYGPATEAELRDAIRQPESGKQYGRTTLRRAISEARAQGWICKKAKKGKRGRPINVWSSIVPQEYGK